MVGLIIIGIAAARKMVVAISIRHAIIRLGAGGNGTMIIMVSVVTSFGANKEKTS
jgi:hypothetical protein